MLALHLGKQIRIKTGINIDVQSCPCKNSYMDIHVTVHIKYFIMFPLQCLLKFVNGNKNCQFYLLNSPTVFNLTFVSQR